MNGAFDSGTARTTRTLAILMAAAVTTLLFVGTMGRWPWDHDEVHSLVELGLVPLDRYPGPVAQLARMHQLVPVWHVVQRAMLTVLPRNEWGTRATGSISGTLFVVIALIAGLRSRGTWFGWSLFILAAGSQTLIWLSQQNRFYALALLWSLLACLCIWTQDRRARWDILAGVFALAAVLTHNLTVVIFGLGAGAAVVAWFVTGMPLHSVRRAVIAAVVVAVAYFFYLRPLLTGWLSGNTGGTSPLVSFVAQIGIVPVALAMLGSAVALVQRRDAFLVWWVVVLAGGVAFVTVSPVLLGNWNPRYGLFFMPPFWVVGAIGAAAVAEALPARTLAVVWILTIAVLQAPKLASHFVDGSRHDFRTAASLVVSARGNASVLTNWPAELQYYMEPRSGVKPRYWVPGMPIAEDDAIVVMASNAWEPVLGVAGKEVRIVGEVGRRRFDEQSHQIRVYRVTTIARASSDTTTR